MNLRYLTLALGSFLALAGAGVAGAQPVPGQSLNEIEQRRQDEERQRMGPAAAQRQTHGWPPAPDKAEDGRARHPWVNNKGNPFEQQLEQRRQREAEGRRMDEATARFRMLGQQAARDKAEDGRRPPGSPPGWHDETRHDGHMTPAGQRQMNREPHRDGDRIDDRRH